MSFFFSKISGIGFIHSWNISMILRACSPFKNGTPSSRTLSSLYMFGFGPCRALLIICKRPLVTNGTHDLWMILIKKHWINFVCHLTKFIHTPFVSTVTYSLAAWLNVCVRPESSSNDDTCEFTLFWASWRNFSHCLFMYLTCFGHCPRSLEQTARWQALHEVHFIYKWLGDDFIGQWSTLSSK